MHKMTVLDTIDLDFSAWVKIKQAHIENILNSLLPLETLAPQKLHSAMRYSALNGGKRVRALLSYAAAEFCNANENIADAAACAVELIHAYSLVHDDMPCMDDDDLRRGKPSCHKQYDDATALLVGDALQSLAFEVLSTKNLMVLPSNEKDLTSFYRHISANESHPQIQMLSILAKASGSLGMAGGQAIDLTSVGKPLKQAELENMHQLKTGALIQAAILMTSVTSTPEKIVALRAFADTIGLAFQVIDDILDIEADTETLGKTAGKDVNSNKPTYVTVLGLDAAKLHAQALHYKALKALQAYGSEALRLRELASFIMQRSY